MQFWSEIILVISNRTRPARSFDFEITRTISDQIALHSVQLPLLINFSSPCLELGVRVSAQCFFAKIIFKLTIDISMRKIVFKMEYFINSRIYQMLKFF